MRKTLKNSDWTLSYDDDFDAVIHHCATLTVVVEKRARGLLRPYGAYLRLHELGLAHSVEVGRTVNLLEASTVFSGKYVLRRINVLPAGKCLKGSVHSAAVGLPQF